MLVSSCRSPSRIPVESARPHLQRSRRCAGGTQYQPDHRLPHTPFVQGRLRQGLRLSTASQRLSGMLGASTSEEPLAEERGADEGKATRGLPCLLPKRGYGSLASQVITGGSACLMPADVSAAVRPSQRPALYLVGGSGSGRTGQVRRGSHFYFDFYFVAPGQSPRHECG
jgi:hypothetical protein